jgi:hypothetical protein
MNFELEIDFTTAQVKSLLAAGQRVTIVKSVAGGGSTTVAWLAFSPFNSNDVTWTESYYIYSTTSSLTAGTMLKQASETDDPAILGHWYALSGNVFADEGSQSIYAGQYAAINENGQNNLSFGLSQDALVNGADVLAPICAIPVLNTNVATFVPSQNLSVYMSNTINNGVVVSSVSSTATTVSLTTQHNKGTLTYDSTNNQFSVIYSSV